MNDIQAILKNFPCDKDCQFTQGGSISTLVCYPARYDKDGVNTNPDRNTTTTSYSCLTCKKDFTVKSGYGRETTVLENTDNWLNGLPT